MTTTTRTAPRRRKGEGSVSRFHNHPTCPPVVDGVRPDHKCKGPYRARTWVRTTTGDRVRKTVYGKTEREVLNKVKGLTVAEGAGKVVSSSPTVEQWMRTDAAEHGISNWWTEAAPKLKVNTRKGYASKINQYILPGVGHFRLDRLTPDHVLSMYADMRSRGLAETSCSGVHAILRRALAVAMRRGKVAVNVCDLVDRPSQQSKTPRRALTPEEARKVLRLAGDNPRYWLALLEGVRQGEALALRWCDVYLTDVPVPFIVVERAASREPGVGVVYDTPKSEASTGRVVPLVPMVAARLRLAREVAFNKGATDTDLVFTNRAGNAVDPRSDWQGWTTLLELAGVPHTPLHAARNTTASLLENAKVPDRVVAEILGHANVQMTHRYQRGNLAAVSEGMKALADYMTEVQAVEDVV